MTVAASVVFSSHCEAPRVSQEACAPEAWTVPQYVTFPGSQLAGHEHVHITLGWHRSEGDC